MPVEFDPSSFNLERLKTNYLDFEVVFNNLDSILQGVLITIALALLAEGSRDSLGSYSPCSRSAARGY